jgi:hypothetical protein
MESVKCMVACIYCMVLLKGGSHYEQFVIVQKKEDRISKRTKKGKGQTTLAVEYPNVYRNRYIWSTNKLRGTLTEVPLQLTICKLGLGCETWNLKSM